MGEDMKNVTIEELILDYVQNSITEDIKEEFINAALHFIINQDNCSQSDIIKIKYRFKKIESNEVLDYIKLCSTYVYIIYRSLLLDLVEESEKSKCCEALIEISNEMTKYVTMEIDEEQLRKKMELAISNLDISESCNNVVLEKLKGAEYKFWIN